MESRQYLQANEIDLNDFVKAIIKWKELILAIFLVSVSVCALANFLGPKEYEISSIIQLGNIEGPLINKEEAKAMILNQDLLSSVVNRLNLKMEADSLERNIKVIDIKGTDLLLVRIIWPDVDKALKVYDLIIPPFITEGRNSYQTQLFSINARIKKSGVRIKEVKSKIIEAQNTIQNNLLEYKRDLIELEKQVKDLDLSLSIAKDFKVLEAPTRPKNAVWYRKKVNVVIIGAISFLLGILLALYLEFWPKIKKNNQPG